MPWWVDRETRKIVGFSGRKMTAEDYEQRADATLDNWVKGYQGGEFQDVIAWVELDRERAKQLRAAARDA